MGYYTPQAAFLYHILMKKILPSFIVVACFFIAQVNAQKEDYVWMLGGGIGSPDSVFKSCSLDFSTNPFTVNYINKDLPYIFTNTSICDTSGKLICYSNGENIYNNTHQTIENGDDFYPNTAYTQGYPGVQGYLLLPSPGNFGQIAYVNGSIKVVDSPAGFTLGYVNLKSAFIDMNLNMGEGKVIQRDIIVSTDTLMPYQITASKHGNGRDWWIIIPNYHYQQVHRYLLSMQGLKYLGPQNKPMANPGLGQACFSPDGRWYARFNVHGITDSSYSTFDLYPFDRCSGLLGQRSTKTYDWSGLTGKPGGVAFSPSSRFMYISRWDTIFQYDLQALDIVDSEVAVAVYDGFLGDFNRPTRFYSLQLAPDNKIYCCVANNNSRYLHVIEYPDSAGVACSVQQHAIELPVFNMFLLPNLPYYRLYDWPDSPCDTLGINGPTSADQQFVDASQVRLFPNPASGWLTLESAPHGTKPLWVRFFDAQGRLVLKQGYPEGIHTYSFDIGELRPGYYLVEIEYRDGRRLVEKLVVGR